MDRASSSPPLRRRASRSWLGAVFGGTARMVLFAGFLTTKFLTETPHLLAVLTSETSASESVFNAVTKAVDAFRAASQALCRTSLIGAINHHPHSAAATAAAAVCFLDFIACLILSIGVGGVLLIMAATFATVASPIALVVDVIVATTQPPRQNIAEPPLLLANQNLPQDLARDDDDIKDFNRRSIVGLLLISILILCYRGVGLKKLGNRCGSDNECAPALYCSDGNGNSFAKRCVRTTVTNPFHAVGTSLPFNKYAFLTTHNSFSIITRETRLTWLCNQEDSVTDQLKNGVRALMLDVYDFDNDVWLCHSYGGQCYSPASFVPALYTLREIEGFLVANPSEIVTLILEDHVASRDGLTKLFNKTGLRMYWFPVEKMPRNGDDWPIVSDMIKNNHRLLVFTSNRSKESSEGIAYQWNYMVENQYGSVGMDPGACYNRSESPFLGDRTKSLVLVNYFRTYPNQQVASMDHSRGLKDVLKSCHAATGNRWANFLAVDFYKRSDGGGVFEAIDILNGRLICGLNDVSSCRERTLMKAFNNLLLKFGLAWNGPDKHNGGGNVALSDRDQDIDIVSTQEEITLLEEMVADPKYNHNEEASKLVDDEPHDEF